MRPGCERSGARRLKGGACGAGRKSRDRTRGNEKRGGNTMTMLAKEETRALTLADYEARIWLYKEQIGTGYIGIGRTLTEAKEAGVVPHGEWEDWVLRTTGLNPRQAQRCMQAAREIREGSQMARLEMSKALLLLSSGLDEDARERIARDAADEGATVRQLRAEIEQTKKDLAWAESKAAEETGNTTQAKLQALEYKEMAEGLRADLEKSRKEAGSMRAQLETVKEYVEDQKRIAAEAAADEAMKKAGETIDDLRAELAAAEEREEQRAAEMRRLKNDRQLRAMEEARGLTASPVAGTDVAAAVRAFMGAAGALPQMEAEIRAMPKREREALRSSIETVAAWVDGARAALGVYVVPDAVVR